ncbi:MAG: tRNA (adenosine(37)-N6)-threonylcarbamoyltransferase complex transferase subunit TsaD [Acidobacteria bacterium]|nr:MAG: tRNA (adenosine(37)-N6)-threonylcarbamoyltransferase complex transferase subunit TsaD [Acidobacteriota bacterium]
MAKSPEFFDGLVLGVETSCDETSAAVVRNGLDLLSVVVSSQIDEHARFGGVVPEIASRAHLENLQPVIRGALGQAGIEMRDVDAVAVTNGPGLAGALLVGIAGAKALALAIDVPMVAVNHLEGHLFASLLSGQEVELPAIALLVSGGHTMLVVIRDWGDYLVVGSTLDDAAGEAFDKVGRYLDLGFPGGPAMEKAACDGNPAAYDLPRAMLRDGYDFSFSGLKTAVVNAVEAQNSSGDALSVPDMAASFQEAVIEVLAVKAIKAAVDFGSTNVLVGGGVAANGRLRSRLTEAGEEAGVRILVSPRELCTDNAAMIASAGAFRLAKSGASPLSTGAAPSLRAPFVLAQESRAARGSRE